MGLHDKGLDDGEFVSTTAGELGLDWSRPAIRTDSNLISGHETMTQDSLEKLKEPGCGDADSAWTALLNFTNQENILVMEAPQALFLGPTSSSNTPPNQHEPANEYNCHMSYSVPNSTHQMDEGLIPVSNTPLNSLSELLSQSGSPYMPGREALKGSSLEPSVIIHHKERLRGQRVQSDPIFLLALCEDPSPLDVACRKLLSYILNSDHYRYDLPEPKLGTTDGEAVLDYLRETFHVSFPQHRVKKGYPISILLTDSRKCLICGTVKSSSQRAVECVNAHLDYRPFWCGGSLSGCQKCYPGHQSMRFFSTRLLKEHSKGSQQRVTCPVCQREFCRKSLRRHWDTLHPMLPFFRTEFQV